MYHAVRCIRVDGRLENKKQSFEKPYSNKIPPFVVGGILNNYWLRNRQEHSWMLAELAKIREYSIRLSRISYFFVFQPVENITELETAFICFEKESCSSSS